MPDIHTHRSDSADRSMAPSPPFLQDMGPIVLHASIPPIYRCMFNMQNYDDDWYRVLGIRLPERIAASVSKRRAEYLAGRYAARLALSDLGLAHLDIPSSEERAPVWPSGTVGAITHNDSRAMSCAAPAGLFHGIGIDVENIVTRALFFQIRASIVNDDELRYLESVDCPLEPGFTLVFSAKESLFKCLYRRVGRFFDFLDAELVNVDLAKSTFTLCLLRPLGVSLPEGTTFSGHFRFSSTEVLTQIVVPVPEALAI